jgi:hypothetical protein
VHVVDAGHVRNLELDSLGFVGTPEHLLIPRFELDSHSDWNRDGDQQDTVFFAWHPASNQTLDTAIACSSVLGASGERLLMGVTEHADRRDWNHDGDMDDLAYVRHDFAARRNVGLDLVGAFPGAGMVLAEGRTVVLVDEAAHEADLNQDGDRADSVPFVSE